MNCCLRKSWFNAELGKTKLNLTWRIQPPSTLGHLGFPVRQNSGGCRDRYFAFPTVFGGSDKLAYPAETGDKMDVPRVSKVSVRLACPTERNNKMVGPHPHQTTPTPGNHRSWEVCCGGGISESADPTWRLFVTEDMRSDSRPRISKS